MAKQSTWYNADGLGQGYGPHGADNDTGSTFTGANNEKVMEVRIPNAANLEYIDDIESGIGTVSQPGYWRNAAIIPAGSTIHSAHIRADVGIVIGSEGPTESPTVEVGTWTQDAATGLYQTTNQSSLITGSDYDVDELANDGDTIVFQRGVYNDFNGINTSTSAALLVKDSGATTEDYIVIPTVISGSFASGEVTITITYHTN